MKDFVTLAGRVLLLAIFLPSAWNKATAFSATADRMADQGVPLAAATLVFALVLEIVGSLLVLLGLRARLGAAMLALFLVPVTLTMHAYWAFPPEEQMSQQVHLLKNISILGGVLMVLAHGSGRLSLDVVLERRRRRRR